MAAGPGPTTARSGLPPRRGGSRRPKPIRSPRRIRPASRARGRRPAWGGRTRGPARRRGRKPAWRRWSWPPGGRPLDGWCRSARLEPVRRGCRGAGWPAPGGGSSRARSSGRCSGTTVRVAARKAWAATWPPKMKLSGRGDPAGVHARHMSSPAASSCRMLDRSTGRAVYRLPGAPPDRVAARPGPAGAVAGAGRAGCAGRRPDTPTQPLPLRRWRLRSTGCQAGAVRPPTSPGCAARTRCPARSHGPCRPGRPRSDGGRPRPAGG